MSGQERIALLVGAGLNKDAGLPTSDGLAMKLRAKLNELTQPSASRAPKSPETAHAMRLLALFNFLEGGVRFQEGVLNRNPSRAVNIEQVAVAALELQARATNPIAIYSAGWHSRLEDLERSDPTILSSFVEFIYSCLQEWLTLDDQRRISYLRGLGSLRVDQRGLDIFTLNYDLCVENALTLESIKFLNGFDEKGVWSSRSFTEECGVRLFKLHGSLDWVDDEIYGLCSLKFPKNENSLTIDGDNVRPLLIFGTAHKLSPREPFLTLTYHFSQRLLRAQILVVIGYSFGDEHVNQIIEQGLKKNVALRVVVVSPDADILVASHRFLDRNPRIITLVESARAAFDGRTLVDKIRSVLQDLSEDIPF